MSNQELDKEVKDEWEKMIPLSKILIKFLPLKGRLLSYDYLIGSKVVHRSRRSSRQPPRLVRPISPSICPPQKPPQLVCPISHMSAQ
jgi:hypothetical protein